MKKAIGLVEVKNVAKGIMVADAMLKAGNVTLNMAMPLCPGKYIILISGDVGAVLSSVQSGKSVGQDTIVDDFILPSPHDSLYQAMAGNTDIKEIKALGIIETYSVASGIIAGDAAAKAAAVQLIEIRLARGMGGKAVITLTGDVGAVTAAVKAGSATVERSGFLVDQVVIPAPQKGLHEMLL
ncbi:MAG: microcompartment protein [Firmicutes bacterium]|nr:microcompartment protein [Bacillota bacterium]